MATTLSVNEETPRIGEAADMLDVTLMALRLRDAREFHDGA